MSTVTGDQHVNNLYDGFGNRVAQTVGGLPTTSAGRLLSDGLGCVRHVTDEAGELVSTHEFDPYGVPLTEPAGLISQYVRGNVVNRLYPDSGCDRRDCRLEVFSVPVGVTLAGSHLFLVHKAPHGLDSQMRINNALSKANIADMRH